MSADASARLDRANRSRSSSSASSGVSSVRARSRSTFVLPSRTGSISGLAYPPRRAGTPPPPGGPPGGGDDQLSGPSGRVGASAPGVAGVGSAAVGLLDRLDGLTRHDRPHLRGVGEGQRLAAGAAPPRGGAGPPGPCL